MAGRPKKVILDDSSGDKELEGGDFDRDECNTLIDIITDHLNGYISFTTHDIKRVQDFLLSL